MNTIRLTQAAIDEADRVGRGRILLRGDSRAAGQEEPMSTRVLTPEDISSARPAPSRGVDEMSTRILTAEEVATLPTHRHPQGDYEVGDPVAMLSVSHEALRAEAKTATENLAHVISLHQAEMAHRSRLEIEAHEAKEVAWKALGWEPDLEAEPAPSLRATIDALILPAKAYLRLTADGDAGMVARLQAFGAASVERQRAVNALRVLVASLTDDDHTYNAEQGAAIEAAQAVLARFDSECAVRRRARGDE